jgi:Domain of unknown function (DUF4157)
MRPGWAGSANAPSQPPHETAAPVSGEPVDGHHRDAAVTWPAYTGIVMLTGAPGERAPSPMQTNHGPAVGHQPVSRVTLRQAVQHAARPSQVAPLLAHEVPLSPGAGLAEAAVRRWAGGTQQVPGASLSGKGDAGHAGVIALQRAAGNAETAGPVDKDLSVVHDVLASGGATLEPAVRAEMEGRFGQDFGDVRVHTDRAAHDSAKSINAQAYTVGSDIVFQRDKYDPASAPGKHMLAHELTHVVQQRNGPVDGTDAGGGFRISDPSDRFEREAVVNADRVMSTSMTVPDRGFARWSEGAESSLQRQDTPVDEDAPVDEEAPAAENQDQTPQPEQGEAGVDNLLAAAQVLVGETIPVSLSAPDALPVPDPSGVGDYPTTGETGPGSTPPTVMAYANGHTSIQRDDPPHVSGDVTGQVGGTAGQPLQLQFGGTLIYRNLDAWQSADGNWEFLHEPQIQVVPQFQLTGGSGTTLSIQESIALIDVHWKPLWDKDIEFSLSVFEQSQLFPTLSNSGGVQVGKEIHVTEAFGVTGSVSCAYTPPSVPGQPGGWLWSGGGGVVIHLDKLF